MMSWEQKSLLEELDAYKIFNIRHVTCYVLMDTRRKDVI